MPKLNSLYEAIIYKDLTPAQEKIPGIQMSVTIAGHLARLFGQEQAIIQILPRTGEWASTVRASYKGKNIEINVIVNDQNAICKVMKPKPPGNVRSPYSFGRAIEPQPLAQFDLMQPDSFERSAAEAYKYLKL